MNVTRRKRRQRDQVRIDWIGKILIFVMFAVFIGGVCFAEQRASRRLRRATVRDSVRVTLPGDCCVFCSYGDHKCPPSAASSLTTLDFRKRMG